MKHFLNSFAAAVALTVSAAFASAQQAQPLPIDPQVRYGKLENGLTYYIRHNEEPKGLVDFYIAQKVGSIQEDENQRGLAHFLEHMCFNGSVNFPADGSLIKYCESIGVKFGQNLNAYTSTDETVYNIDDIPVTEANLDSCMLILHDWADGLLLEEGEIQKERGVIHEEWRMRSSAQQRILERRLPELYPDSKYGLRMPIGLMSVVDNFAPDFLRAYYEKWYRPDLQGVVIVGDIDVDAIEAKIKAVFGPIQMPQNPAKYETYPVPDNDKAIYVIDKDKELNNPLIIANFKSDPLPEEMNGTMFRYVQSYMTDIISMVLNSRFSELSQKADCPFAVAQADYGKFLISKSKDAFEIVIVPKPGQEAAAVKAAMMELERARKFGLTETEVARAREEFLSQVEEVYDNRTKQRNSFYVDQYVRHFLDNEAIPGIETEEQLYKMLAPQITAEVLNQTLQQLTESTDKNFVFLGMFPEKDGVAVPTPEEMKAAVEAAASAQIEAYVDNVKNEPLISALPKKGKIKKVSAADFGYTKLSLANGANVYYRKTDFNDSQVIMRAVSKGGLSLIPEEDILNGKLTPTVINASGLGNFNSVELDKALAGKQVSVSANIGRLTETLSGNSTPKDLRTLFELTYLRFQGAADDPDAYNSTIAQLRTSLENAEKVPTTALSDSINTTIYGRSPRMKSSMKLKDLEKADYDKIKSIYNDRFAAAGDFDFFFTGNFDEDSLKLYVEQYIAPLAKAKKRENFHSWNIFPREGIIENRFTRDMETPQAYIFQVWSGAMPYDVNRSAVVNAFGSILSQRLLKSIREDGGMAYSVQASAQAEYGERDEYLMQIVCPFTPGLCDSVLFLMDKGIRDIAKDGVTDEELETVKKFELKDYADQQRLNGHWSSLIASKVVWGKDEDAGYEDALKNLSSAEIQAFANDYLLKQMNRSTIIMLPSDMTEKQ